jgi:hypothetical protein
MKHSRVQKSWRSYRSGGPSYKRFRHETTLAAKLQLQFARVKTCKSCNSGLVGTQLIEVKTLPSDETV